MEKILIKGAGDLASGTDVYYGLCNESDLKI